MKLQFLHNIDNNGQFTDVVSNQLIRLFDFDHLQAAEFSKVVKETIIEKQMPLHLNSLGFIDAINCDVTLRIAKEDIGLTTNNNINFYCDLTFETYQNMLQLIASFCHEGCSGFQWLYDINTPIDFLFSKDGFW